MLAEHLPESERQGAVNQAIDFTRRLFRHGYHGFESMRRTDLDYRPSHHNPAFLTMLQREQAAVEAANSEPVAQSADNKQPVQAS